MPRAALGPALNEQGYYVGRVERNLYWITDGTHQSAFLTTSDGVVRSMRRRRRPQHPACCDEIASANGVSNKVTI